MKTFVEKYPAVVASGAAFLFMIVFAIIIGQITGPSVCNDGWRSGSIGIKGACSHHGGVSGSWWGLLNLLCSGAVWFRVFAKLGQAADTRPTQKEPASFVVSSVVRPSPPLPSPSTLATQLPHSPYEPCPRCGGPMHKRVARRGSRAGQSFLGCVRYPGCSGLRPMPTSTGDQ